MICLPDFIVIALSFLVCAEIGVAGVLVWAYIRTRVFGFLLIFLAEVPPAGFADLLTQFIANRFAPHVVEQPPIAALILTVRFLLFIIGCFLIVRKFVRLKEKHPQVSLGSTSHS
jgi:hypothetical protein